MPVSRPLRERAVKRLLDVGLALPALLLLTPALLAVSAWIKLDSAGPVFFGQARVGRNGNLFRIWKFRSMRAATDSSALQITVANDSRITRCGAFIRRYKLDELPQLLNVVVGEMSLVGPRPEVPRYVEIYPAALRTKILSVRPGITDIASIEFRNENELLEGQSDPETYYLEQILPRKLELAARYVDQRSLCMDVQLIWKTLLKIVFP
jgi:lipopolysaccharide/colanic/teichoic acid biosynthesis glycosyltransferase